MEDQKAIGVFDSGVGGTSIWKEIVCRLPHENTLYLADSKNAPYGPKSREEILKLSIKNTEKLLELGAKIIVVACNTATTNAIAHLRDNYNVPFIGIEPAIKPAALKSKTGAVGILATQGTLNSVLFHTTATQFASNLNIIEVIGEGLVPLIENGDLDSPQLRNLLIEYTKPMLKAQVDYVVLGCSHYPYLIPILRSMLPPEVTIIDSAQAVARQTEHILSKMNMLGTSAQTTHKLFTNGNREVLERLLSNFRKNLPSHSSIDVDVLDF